MQQARIVKETVKIMGRIRVVVTGMGIVSPVGNDLESSWNAIARGNSGISRITLFDTSAFKTCIAGEVKNFDPEILFGHREARRMDRFTQFMMAASMQAKDHSKLLMNHLELERTGVIIGSGIGGIGTMLVEATKLVNEGPHRVSPHFVPMMLPDTAPGKLAIELGLRGPNMSIATACASATNAIGEAAAMIQRRACDVVFSGGAEAAIVPLAIAGFSNMGALSENNDDPIHASRPFDKNRDGFITGEGAGILVLESDEHARKRGAKIYAEILGYGASADAYHITAPTENGDGAALAMQRALDDANLVPGDIHYLNAHGTSTQLNDRSETRAIKQVFGKHAYEIPISSTKSMTGHLLGAGGAIEAIFSIQTLETGIIPPTINYETPDPDCDLDYVPNTARQGKIDTVLSNSFGFGGHNACLIFGRYKNG
jgi:3-oxoacyl-[acyl-carrier-protein] synthase II